MTRPEFDILIQQLGRKLYGFAFRILRNREEAEDVVQEIFIKLWNMGSKLDEYKSVDALAITMTRNHCLDLVRKQRYDVRADHSLLEMQDHIYPSPQEQMINNESGRLLRMIIDDLPENYRAVIEMRDIDGISYEEIAVKTNQKVNALRVILSRARKMIRDEFNKYQYERRRVENTDRKVL
jgi:RNA polymerase sigma factor (sigma-70 family)